MQTSPRAPTHLAAALSRLQPQMTHALLTPSLLLAPILPPGSSQFAELEIPNNAPQFTQP